MSPVTLLAFERAHPRHDGAKEETIRGELGITPARYYVLLGRAARSMEGMVADPITARRVRERSNVQRSIRMGYTLGYTRQNLGAAPGI
jgi:hypothetical protein